MLTRFFFNDRAQNWHSQYRLSTVYRHIEQSETSEFIQMVMFLYIDIDQMVELLRVYLHVSFVHEWEIINTKLSR